MIRSNYYTMLKREIPSTRYVGSKQKIVDWIWESIADLEFESFLDLFGGSGIVGYVAKINGKEVIYNDYLKFNHQIGKAIIENNREILTNEDLIFILSEHDFKYPSFIQDTFSEVYFTDEENRWLDIVITNISKLSNEHKKALAYYCLFQSCIRKRPYNLFHRKNLYIRLAKVKRSFGNKTTWETPFEKHFKEFAQEVNKLILDNQKNNLSINYNALAFPKEISADLVYIDTPYFSAHSNIGTDYRDFYHFLEGICNYENWEEKIDKKSKHLRLKKEKTIWENKNEIHSGFENLFKRFKDKIIVVSYRSNGVPSEEEMINLLKKYKKNIKVYRKNFKYALSHNGCEELLFVGS